MTAGPPAALLLTAARPRLDASAGARLGTLAAATNDWNRVRSAAGAHGVLPSLTRALETWAADAVPPEALQRLRDAARASGHRSLRLAGELVRIMARLASAGIDALAYKGPTLAVLAYGDLGLRPFRDLDIVVDPSAVVPSRRVLEGLGYRHGPLEPPPRRQATLLATGCEDAYFRENGDIIELHWRILPPYFAMRLEFAELWERRAAVPLGGRTVPTLSREDLVLALCAHGTQHRWERLEWIADVARLLYTDAGVDWGVAVERARRLGGTRMVGLAVRLAADLLGAQAPEACASLAADPAVARLAATVGADLFRRSPPCRELTLTDRSFHVRAQDRMRDRVRYLWHAAVIPNQPDWALVRLPEPLRGLYYLIRPLRLAVKYARLLFRPAPH